MADQEQAVYPPTRIVLDGRRPKLLDHRGHVLQVTAGHVDVFAVSMIEGSTDRRATSSVSGRERRDPSRPAEQSVDSSGSRIQVIAVGGPGAEAQVVPRLEIRSLDLVAAWITRLAGLIAGPNPSWEMRELAHEGATEIPPGERRRGPVRNIVWVALQAGTAKLMGLDPVLAAGRPAFAADVGDVDRSRPICLHRRRERQHAGCRMCCGAPSINSIGCAMACIQDHLARDVARETQRLVRRSELTTAQTFESFDRLSAIVVRRPDRAEWRQTPRIPCSPPAGWSRRRVARRSLSLPGLPRPNRNSADVVEIARTARLRVRQTLLRGEWWKQDVGPLLAWHGEERHPVALIRGARGGYAMIDPSTGTRRPVDRSLAMELAPEAVTFYPALPSHPLRFRDLLIFSFRHSSGNVGRIALAVVAMGLLSLVTPLITNVLVTSVIPRTELDQLVFCALALAVTAVAMASIQAMEGLAMLRLEGLIDWKLQAAVIDRLLRLPASLFREYTVGDFVDRSMGIDAARRILTGRVLRGMMAGLFCWFSIGLMLYYDLKLGLVALALTIVRALLIIATSAIRLYHENQALQPAGQDRRLRAAADLGNRQAPRRRRDGSRAGGVVETVRDPETVLRRLAAGRQRARRFRGVVSDCRHADHFRDGRVCQERAACSTSAAFSPSSPHSANRWRRSARGPRA